MDSGVLDRLRAELERVPSLKLFAAAAYLGRTPDQLKRELRRLGTSFTVERRKVLARTNVRPVAWTLIERLEIMGAARHLAEVEGLRPPSEEEVAADFRRSGKDAATYLRSLRQAAAHRDTAS